MKQSITGLLELLLQLETYSISLYRNIALRNEKDDYKIRNLANVLAREEMRHEGIYRQMMNDQLTFSNLMVESQLIENVKKALVDFERTLNQLSFKTVHQLLEFALEAEMKTSEMLKGILELLIDEDQEHTGQLISIFEKLIMEEQRHAHNIKTII